MCVTSETAGSWSLVARRYKLTMLNVNALLAKQAGKRVYFDTPIFIYLLSNHTLYAPMCLQSLQACSDREILGFSGDVTLGELLVKPLQNNDAKAVAAVRELLTQDGAITLVSHSRKAFERAAEMRALHGLKMVDALQLATALEAGASCFVGNDRDFPPIPEIECVRLD